MMLITKSSTDFTICRNLWNSHKFRNWTAQSLK